MKENRHEIILIQMTDIQHCWGQLLGAEAGRISGDKPVSVEGSTSPLSWRNPYPREQSFPPYLLQEDGHTYFSKTFLSYSVKLEKLSKALKGSVRDPQCLTSRSFCIGRCSGELGGRINSLVKEKYIT